MNDKPVQVEIPNMLIKYLIANLASLFSFKP